MLEIPSSQKNGAALICAIFSSAQPLGGRDFSPTGNPGLDHQRRE